MRPGALLLYCRGLASCFGNEIDHFYDKVHSRGREQTHHWAHLPAITLPHADMPASAQLLSEAALALEYGLFAQVSV